jgi:hypothetical protein
MDMLRSMIVYTDLLIHFLGNALSTTAYILNKLRPNFHTQSILDKQ